MGIVENTLKDGYPSIKASAINKKLTILKAFPIISFVETMTLPLALIIPA